MTFPLQLFHTANETKNSFNYYCNQSPEAREWNMVISQDFRMEIFVFFMMEGFGSAFLWMGIENVCERIFGENWRVAAIVKEKSNKPKLKSKVESWKFFYKGYKIKIFGKCFSHLAFCSLEKCKVSKIP